VLPCGAGKTLLGISAINIVKKKSLIFCVDNLGITQWKN
jgi:DNA excision repair protein ERCC-3